MVLYTLYVVNKAGGLIYTKDFAPSAVRKTGNASLRMASTFHSLHAISSQLAPVTNGGIEMLEAKTFVLQCYHTFTGLKFFVTASPGSTGLSAFLKGVYTLYTDYALKNPFYELEMPVRCELFEKNLAAYAGRFTK